MPDRLEGGTDFLPFQLCTGSIRRASVVGLDTYFSSPWTSWQESCFFPLSFPGPCPFRGEGGGWDPHPRSTSGGLPAPPRGLSILLKETGAHRGGQDLGHLARSPRPSWALPTLRGTRANATHLVPPASSRTRAGPSRAPHSEKPGSRSSPSAYLASLVELLLQPRHRHSAFRRRTSRWDPVNRRNSASDRLPGAAEPPRASAGPVGTASAALSPAPRPPGRSLSPSRARAARILHGNRTLPAPAGSEHAHAHFSCLGSGRFCHRVSRRESRAARAAAATPRSWEVVLSNALRKA